MKSKKSGIKGIWESLFSGAKRPQGDACAPERPGPAGAQGEPGDAALLLPPQPPQSGDWVLTLGDAPGPLSCPAWEAIEAGLRRLSQADDSFLILEQATPQDPKTTWFIQCAVALRGLHQGEYAVEIGIASAAGNGLWEHIVPDVEQAIGYFSAAYHRRKIDPGAFRKMEL